MKLVTSAKFILFAVGIGVSVGACDGGMDMPTAYTWKDVSTDIKNLGCAATGCHAKTPMNAKVFNYDTTLVPGQDKANYDGLMAAMPAMINKSAPATSLLLTVGQGGMWMGGAHPAGASLPTAKGTSWTAWITAGATYP